MSRWPSARRQGSGRCCGNAVPGTSETALVRREDNERALSMLVGLGELLDRTRHRAYEPTLSLGEEIAFVRGFGALQQQRFADRLTIDFDVSADCETAQVPAFLLQPLVENAIRHGIGRRAGSGRVTVTVARRQDRLVIAVEDDGTGFPAGFELDGQTGIGIANIRSRLVQHYGQAASLEATNRPEGGAASSSQSGFWRARGPAI